MLKIIKDITFEKIHIILKNNNVIIGNLYAVVRDNLCTLLSLYIKDDCRNNGYGTLLLKKFIKICKNKKIKKWDQASNRRELKAIT